MAFKLSKAEDTRKSELEGKLEELAGSMGDARDELEAAVRELIETFNEKHVDPFNEALGDAHGFVEDIANERQGEFDDKSERWQEGERGQAAQDWLQNWENATSDLGVMTHVEVPEIEMDIPDAANILMELPAEMDG